MTAPEKDPAALETAGLEIAIQRQQKAAPTPARTKITTTVGAVDKSAPIPAEDALDTVASMLALNDGRNYVCGPDFDLAYKIVRALAEQDRAARDSQEERIREDERAPKTVDALEGLFWLELREPGLVPQRKGPWPHARTKDILREFMKANPSAYISVVTISHDGPWFDDAPETLGIVDGRCWPTARKHIASSSAAHARLRGGAS